MELLEIEKDINEIKERNKKVEAEKAWEISMMRISLIVVFTYITTSIAFYFIGIKDYYFNAFIPAIAYFLSTQSLPFIKKWWISRYIKSK